MRKLIVVLTMVIFGLGVVAMEDMSIKRALLTKGIENKEPLEETSSYKLYSKGYFYMEAVKVGDEKTIMHRWYIIADDGEKTLMAEVPLKVMGTRWRTWSSKNLYIPGKWIVEAVLLEGNDNEELLDTKEFTVE